MSWGNGIALWIGAFVVPGLLAFLIWADRSRRLAAQAFVSARLAPILVRGVSWPRRRLKMLFWWAGVVMLFVALARPRYGMSDETTRTRGLDLMIGIDTSRSMLATDLKPNRLTRAKLAAEDLLRLSGKDRLGLVAFAGGAFLQCPLTLDDEAFRSTLKDLDTDIIPEGGTALGEAIETCVRAFGMEPGAARALVLISDGEDHEDGAIEAARKAAAQGMRIFCLGVGSESGEILSMKDPRGEPVFVKDADGNVVKSRLNADLLRKISEATGGFYLNLDQSGAVDILFRRGLEPMPRTLGAMKSVKTYRERFQWPLAIGFALLLLEWMIRESAPRRRKVAKSVATTAAVPVAASLLLWILADPSVAQASPTSAARDFEQRRYDAALDEYSRLAGKHPEDPRFRFNAAVSAMKLKEWQKALDHLKEVTRQPDLDLQGRGYFNSGVAEFELGRGEEDPQKKLGRWEPALEHFNAAAKLRPNDVASLRNRDELARRVEELKKQLPKSPDSSKDQQKNPDDKKDGKNQDKDKNDKQEGKDGSDDSQSKSSEKQQEDPSKSKKKGADGKDSKDDPDDKSEEKEQAESSRDEKKGEEEKKQASQKPGGEDGESGEKKQEEASGRGDGESKEMKDAEEGTTGTGDGTQDDSQKEEKQVMGKLSPVMAERMLDAQKDKEKAFPFHLIERRLKPRPKTGKDW